MIQAKAWEVHCDWPDCKSVVDVNSYEDRSPAWTYFRGGLQVRNGLWIADLCTIHELATLANLAGKNQ